MLGRVTKLLGARSALSPLAWLLPLPLYLAATLVSSPPATAGKFWVLQALSIVCLRDLVVGLVVEIGRRLFGRYLAGDLRSALIVIAVWTVAMSVGFVFYAWLHAAHTSFSPVASRHPAVWIPVLTVQHIVFAVAASAYLSNRTLRAEAVVQHAASHREMVVATIESTRLTAITDEMVRSVVVPELQRLEREVGDARLSKPADPIALTSLADGLMEVAEGPIRRASRAIADQSSATNDIESEARPRKRPLALLALLRVFPRATPVSWIPILILMPMIIASALVVPRTQALGMLVTTTILIGLLALLRRFVRSQFYYRTRIWVEWLIWFVGLAIIGTLMWPLSSWTSAPPALPFLSYTGGSQAVIFGTYLVAMNFATGMVAAGLRYETVEVTELRSRSLRDAGAATRLRLVVSARRRMITSTIHGKIQSRVIALGLLLADAASDPDATDAALARIEHELSGMSREALPALKDLGSTRLDDQVLLPTPELDDLVTQWASVAQVDLRIQPSATSGIRVSQDVADRVLDVVTEALCNAVRHGGAHRCHIDISDLGEILESLTVTVTDDGTGIRARSQQGLGSKLLDECTAGNWQLESTPTGCRLIAQVEG